MAEVVAVITRTKNRPRLLIRCIQSVIGQTFRDWIHVIVNDGGDRKEVEDTVRQFAQEYSGRVRIIHHDKSRGMEAATNSALRTIETEFVALLDDDDTWHEGFLDSAIVTLRGATSSQVKSAICQTEIVHETISGEAIVEISREPFNPDFVALRLSDLLMANRFTNNAMVFHRSVIDEVGFFREDLEALGDWDFNVRLHLRYDAVVVDRILARYHRRIGDGTEKSASYINSVNAVSDPHKLARYRIENEAIRGTWPSGYPHLGVYMVLSRRLEELEAARIRRILHSIVRRLNYPIRKCRELVLRWRAPH